MLRDNLVRLIVPMRSCGTQALGDEFSYLENPRPVGAESSLTGRCSSPFQTEPRQWLLAVVFALNRHRPEHGRNAKSSVAAPGSALSAGSRGAGLPGSTSTRRGR